MGLFGKKKKEQVTSNQKKTADRLIMEQLTTDDDAHVTRLADQLKAGNPLIINFAKLHVDTANKIMAFLAGVVYAIKGHVVTINDDIILFAHEDAYGDGSLEIFLKNL